MIDTVELFKRLITHMLCRVVCVFSQEERRMKKGVKSRSGSEEKGSHQLHEQHLRPDPMRFHYSLADCAVQ